MRFETVAEEVFQLYGRRWKPRTRTVNLGYYRKQILPWFRGRPITAITPREVQDWFASLRATPVAADRSAPVLSVILRQAEVYGYRPENSNPCKGIRRYRRRGRERFLSPDECRRRLSTSLRRHPVGASNRMGAMAWGHCASRASSARPSRASSSVSRNRAMLPLGFCLMPRQELVSRLRSPHSLARNIIARGIFRARLW